MCSGLLSIEPPELRFPVELGKQVTCSLQFINQTKSDVAFKIKTTAPKNYCVRPNIGTVPAGESCDITVTMRASYETPRDMQSKDKFLVQTIRTPDGAQHDNALQELFQKALGHNVNEARLNVKFVPTLPVVENATESISFEPPTLDDHFDNALSMNTFEKKDNVMVKQKAASGFSLWFVLGAAVLGILVAIFLQGELYA